MTRGLLLVALLACGVFLAQAPSSVDSQAVVNQQQRAIRALESQTRSLERIARTLEQIERKLK